jgi:uncharacterized protein
MASSDELFGAIDAGNADLMRSLVAQDPSLAGARDAEGVSALMRARYRLDMAMVDGIIAAGHDLDVFEAASLGELDRLVTLLSDDASLARVYSADGFTPLHFAAFFGKPEVGRLLLERGADVDAAGHGWMTGTPLNSACAGNHVEVARILLEAGADPDARQSHGWTPIHSAARNGSLELVELLLAHGGDPTVVNEDGRSALDLAEGGDAAVADRLRTAVDQREG